MSGPMHPDREAFELGEALDAEFDAWLASQYPPAEQRPVLAVGALAFPIGPPAPRCGLHGDPTASGRCRTCDATTPAWAAHMRARFEAVR